MCGQLIIYYLKETEKIIQPTVQVDFIDIISLHSIQGVPKLRGYGKVGILVLILRFSMTYNK